MNKKNIDVLQNIEKNGLLPKKQFGTFVVQTSKQTPTQTQIETPIATVNENIFASQTTKPSFGALTVKPKKADLSTFANKKKNAIDGFDTDILVNSKYKKIDDKTLKLEMKITKLKEELSEHKKIVDNAYLKSDRNQYQKLLEIQNRMESEIQKLVAQYQSMQLKSMIFTPFVKLFNFLQNYVVLK